MKTITVNASRKYDVLIGRGIIGRTGELVKGVHNPCRVMLVGDDRTGKLYFSVVENSLKDAGFTVEKFIFPHGEKSKRVRTLSAIWEAMAKAHIDRGDLVAAVGGGVTGDMAGFAASTYLRGIEYVQIPTSLLAMVDSSVGGKTAVDLAAGKNLAGAFWQPSLVICDPDVLGTLPLKYYRDGMAEVIKYGMINNPSLLNILEGDPKSVDVSEIIAVCVSDKRAIVEADENDTGVRKLLNFGHTVGHAVECCSGYTISHGFAVAAGMSIVTRSAVKSGICEARAAATLEGLLRLNGLPLGCVFSASELAAAALSDKKRSGGSITLVVPYRAGECRLVDIPTNELFGFIGGGLA